jgi:membrane-bound serine protease (ClpP class)
MNTTERLILAIITTSLQEAALFALWRWGLPHFGIELPLYLLVLGMIAVLIVSVFAFQIGTRTLGRRAVVGLPGMINGRGKVVSPLSPEGQVIIKGEIWSARSMEGDINRSEEIIVIGQDELKLLVHRAKKDVIANNPIH